MPRESAVQAQILAYLEQRGDLMVWRQNTGTVQVGPGRVVKFGEKGTADILAVQAPSGRLVGIEVKRSTGGTVSAAQRRWGDTLTAYGGLYLVARSVAEVRQALGEPVGRVRLSARVGGRVFPGATFDPTRGACDSDPDLDLQQQTGRVK